MKILGAVAVGAGLLLAVLIGQRMTSDTVAIVLGVLFGVLASVPAALLILAAGRRATMQKPTVEPPTLPDIIYTLSVGKPTTEPPVAADKPRMM